MAHVAKFNAKQIAIFGKNETVANVAEALADSNAIIMTGLTYDPNIASNSEQLAGDSLSRDTIFSITDSFAEFSGDTYLPVLGSLATTAVGNTEVVELTVTADAASTNKLVLTDTVNTVTFTFTAPVTKENVALAISNYFNSHTTSGTGYDTTTVPETGSLYTQYSCIVDAASPSVCRLTAETPFVNLVNLQATTTGTDLAVNAPVIKQGSASIAQSVPVTPFLSACNLHTTINTTLGLPAIVQTNFDKVNTNLATIKDNIAVARTGVAQVKAMVDASLQLGANTKLSTIKSDLAFYPNKLDSLVDLVNSFSDNIPDITTTFASNISKNKITTAITTLNTSLGTFYAEFTNANSITVKKFTNILKNTDYTFNGMTIVNTTDTGVYANNPLAAALVYFALHPVTGTVPIGSKTYSYDNGTKIVKDGALNVGTVEGTPAITFTTVAYNSNFTITATKASAITEANKTSLKFITKTTLIESSTFTIVYPAALVASTFLTADVSTTGGYIEDLNSTDTIYYATIQKTFTNVKLILGKIPDLLTNMAVNTSCAKYISILAAANYTLTNLSSVFESLEFTNSLASNSTLTCNIRKNSYDIEEQKNIVITGTKGTVDLNIKIGERPKLKLNLHGNFRSSGVASNDPALTNDLKVQKTNIAPVTQYDNIVLASIYPTGTGKGSTNIAFQSLSATNVDGFSMERTLTGDGNFWYPNPIAHDVTISILEEKAASDDLPDRLSFHPEDNIGKEFDFTFIQGKSTGTTFTVTFTKMTLKSYKHSTQGNVSTQDLTFECAGTTTLALT